MGSGKNKIVFFGTSGICIPFLESLRSEFNIDLIVTQPDAYGGRKKKLIEPAVKQYALLNNIRFIQPEKLTREIAGIIEEINPVIGAVISYGKFIPGKIFRAPEFNTVNVHFSLLPELRGAAPYQRAIEMGLKKTGISIFEIEAEMDAGDIWSRKEFQIFPDDTSESLSERMGNDGAPFLTDTLKSIIKGEIKKKPQDSSQATLAKTVSKEEGRIEWNIIAEEIYNKFRAFYPWPGVSFSSGDKKITIKSMNISGEKSKLSPGTVISLKKEGLKVCCAKGSIVNIYSILPQGKKEMTPYTYSLGNRITEKLD